MAAWIAGKNTSRFIVDSYHYVDHCATDTLCCRWCDPAPTDCSAPNLVVMERVKRGNPYYKCAFNIQEYEQLNVWLGGLEGILRLMTPWNFNWFLHTMLFYNIREVIRKQEFRRRRE
jgi:hypothetical protein